MYGKNVDKADLQMSKAIRYTQEFKQEAVAQVIERGYSVKDTAIRLGISTKSMYDWILSKLYDENHEPLLFFL